MRVLHKRWAITRYGKSSLSITNPEGREVYHSDSTSLPVDGKVLKDYLKDFVKQVEK